MRITNQNQREAREFAARHDGGFDQRARDLRAENARRAAAAVTPIASAKRDLTWLMHDVCSTPYAEVRS